MTFKLTGGCHCGAIRYEINAAQFKRTGYCHCRTCQHTAGAPTIPFFAVSLANEFRYTKGTPAVYRSSEHAERRFCAFCSTQIDFRDDRNPDDIDIQTITLDDPNAAPPSMHIHCENLVSWHHVNDGLPLYQRTPGEEGKNGTQSAVAIELLK